MIIRPVQPQDTPAIAALYAHHVSTGTGTFEIDPPSEVDMQGRIDDVLAKGLPYLVLQSHGEVVGFAYCNWFKPRPAYRFSAEDSIYLSPEIAGKGWGTILMAELLAQAERAGVRKLIAVIGDSANQGSVGLHRSAGFTHVGTIAACGWKFERWLDIVLMERTLGAGAQTAPA
jgi:phosphinothricin acetyltransferase